MKTNSYNIYEEEHSETILYHAVAHNEAEVRELAADKGFDIEGMTIELDKPDVRTQLGRPFEPYIEDALVY